MQQIVPGKCDCADTQAQDFSHRIFYSVAPGDNDQGVLPTSPGGLIVIIHFGKSSSERQTFYLQHFAAL